MTIFDLGAHHEIDPPRGDHEPPCNGRVLVIDQTGPLWTIRCDKCRWEAGRPARLTDPAVKRRMRERHAGFPTRFAGKHFGEDPQNAPTLRAVRAWLTEYRRRALPAPAVYGNPGLGKSHLLVALGERLIREQDASVLFRSIAKLLDELQEAFDHPGQHSLLWHRALSVDVLILDDLGAERQTEWRTDRLGRLVDERWENERPIVLATNVPPGLWERAFDARTASRLRGMTFAVELKGVDRRVAGQPTGETA